MNYRTSELSRYFINGLVATTVHFGILNLNIHVFQFDSAGLANLVGAIFGITTSFLGSRYFVFSENQSPICAQATKFTIFYGCVALFHGLILFVWTDWLELSYQLGFTIATIIQISATYIGNKLFVFKL